jgi:NADPH:quinone reductase-like Zn-dependent oxidoreductase
MAQEKMNAIVASGYGDPAVFRYQKVEKVNPKANQLLVKVETSSATQADTMIRTGKPYFGRLFLGLCKPKKPIPGTGYAGTVEAVGNAVSKFKVGDRVFGETAFGFSSNAEYLVIAEEGIVLKMPEQMKFEEAASWGDGHLTSYNFLKRIAQIKAGQKILINGAAGALGTAAIQIAKYYGAEVTAVCSSRNFPMVKHLGADKVIDYKKEDFTKSEERYDFVFDTVGKSSFKQTKKVLTETGQYLTPVLNFKALLQMIKTSIFGKQKAIFEATGSNPEPKLRAMMEELLELYEAGKLQTVIDRQFPLEKLADAHRYIASGKKKANVIIKH